MTKATQHYVHKTILHCLTAVGRQYYRRITCTRCTYMETTYTRVMHTTYTRRERYARTLVALPYVKSYGYRPIGTINDPGHPIYFPEKKKKNTPHCFYFFQRGVGEGNWRKGCYQLCAIYKLFLLIVNNVIYVAEKKVSSSLT